MKKLICTLITFASLQSSVFAASSKTESGLTKNDVSVNFVQSAQIVSVQTVYPQPFCPAGKMCAAVMPQPELHITVNLYLNGCVDSLGPVASSFSYSDFNYTKQKSKLTIAAVNISNKSSALTKCIMANFATTTIVVGLPNADIDLSDIELQLLK
jgi:hypothetical protein